ncbi:SDR family oxidoreductase [Massilia sp. LXY-6]|uniref:SDR family oxidoreductase n=1 Tax=Massilia sp. LXY-6 TaxID=3379823 RepID=UPI003EE012CD
MPSNVQRKVVVILDAAGMAGEAIARHLVEQGARVALGGSDPARLRELAAEFAWDGGEAIACEADMTRRAQVDRLLDAASERFGRVDVMVGIPVPPADFPYAEGDRARPGLLSGIHALGAIHATIAALAHMRRLGTGHIVNVAPPGGQAIARALSEWSRRVHAQADADRIRMTLVAPSRPCGGAGPEYAASVARAVAFAIGQPAGIDVDEILFRQIRTHAAAYAEA